MARIVAMLALLALPLLASPGMHHPAGLPLLLGGPLPDPACPYRAVHSEVSVLRLVGGAGKRGGRAAAAAPRGGKRVAAQGGAHDQAADQNNEKECEGDTEVPAERADGDETGAAPTPANKGKRSARAALPRGEVERRVKPRKNARDRPVVDGVAEGEAAEDASANEEMAAVNEVGDAAGVAATVAAAEGAVPLQKHADGGGNHQATRLKPQRVPDGKDVHMAARGKEELLGAAEVAAAQATHAALVAALRRLCGEGAVVRAAATPLLPGGGEGRGEEAGDGVREAIEAHLQAARCHLLSSHQLSQPNQIDENSNMF